jgi:hypothetical protein
MTNGIQILITPLQTLASLPKSFPLGSSNSSQNLPPSRPKMIQGNTYPNRNPRDATESKAYWPYFAVGMTLSIFITGILHYWHSIRANLCSSVATSLCSHFRIHVGEFMPAPFILNLTFFIQLNEAKIKGVYPLIPTDTH